LEFMISFASGAAYARDIATLREHLATLRAGALILKIDLYGGGEHALEVRMNAANLYIDGFRNPESETWYRFKDAADWGKTVALPYGGAHRDLLTSDASTVYNGATRYKIEHLAHYDGENADELRRGLSFLVVAISEAVRFPKIEKKLVATVFSTSGTGSPSYMPCAGDFSTLMTNWQNLSDADSDEVAIKYQRGA